MEINVHEGKKISVLCSGFITICPPKILARFVVSQVLVWKALSLNVVLKNVCQHFNYKSSAGTT